jgi:hypothetical protein
VTALPLKRTRRICSALAGRGTRASTRRAFERVGARLRFATDASARSGRTGLMLPPNCERTGPRPARPVIGWAPTVDPLVLLSGIAASRSLALSRERDRRLVEAGAIPVVEEAAQKHGRACCPSASTWERSDDLKTEFDVVANGAIRRRRPRLRRGGPSAAGSDDSPKRIMSLASGAPSRAGRLPCRQRDRALPGDGRMKAFVPTAAAGRFRLGELRSQLRRRSGSIGAIVMSEGRPTDLPGQQGSRVQAWHLGVAAQPLLPRTHST